MFPGSSAVEQPAVNRLVAGSNPARGAKQNQGFSRQSTMQKSAKNQSGATSGATICRLQMFTNTKDLVGYIGSIHLAAVAATRCHNARHSPAESHPFAFED